MHYYYYYYYHHHHHYYDSSLTENTLAVPSSDPVRRTSPPWEGPRHTTSKSSIISYRIRVGREGWG